MPSAPCTTQARSGAEQQQRAGHQLGELRARHADQLPRRAGRIGQRAEQVERGPDAEFAARRPGVAHRRVERRREKEPDAGLGEAALDDGRRRGDADAERLEDVGAAGPARHRAVAVLGHAHAARGDDDARRTRRC